MSILKMLQCSLAITALLASCDMPAKKDGISNGDSSGKRWRKDVTRIIDLSEKEDTLVHHLKDANSDSSFIMLVVNAMKAGTLTAYSNVDHSFTVKFTNADLDNIIATKMDTVVVTDPVTNEEFTKVLKRDFDFDNVHKLRILENWAYDPATGKTEIQIAGVAPIREIYGNDGMFRGVQAMFWLKYDDVKGILNRSLQYHPNHNFNTILWDDYFLSETKPAETK